MITREQATVGQTVKVLDTVTWFKGVKVGVIVQPNKIYKFGCAVEFPDRPRRLWMAFEELEVLGS